MVDLKKEANDFLVELHIAFEPFRWRWGAELGEITASFQANSPAFQAAGVPASEFEIAKSAFNTMGVGVHPHPWVHRFGCFLGLPATEEGILIPVLSLNAQELARQRGIGASLAKEIRALQTLKR